LINGRDRAINGRAIVIERPLSAAKADTARSGWLIKQSIIIDCQLCSETLLPPSTQALKV
jgi:hypothetical protein